MMTALHGESHCLCQNFFVFLKDNAMNGILTVYNHSDHGNPSKFKNCFTNEICPWLFLLMLHCLAGAPKALSNMGPFSVDN